MQTTTPPKDPAPEPSEDVATGRAWEQRGFALVSRCGHLPLLHSFHLPRWEAERAREVAQQTLPEELRAGLGVVEATLHFEFPAPENTSKDVTTE